MHSHLQLDSIEALAGFLGKRGALERGTDPISIALGHESGCFAARPKPQQRHSSFYNRKPFAILDLASQFPGDPVLDSCDWVVAAQVLPLCRVT